MTMTFRSKLKNSMRSAKLSYSYFLVKCGVNVINACKKAGARIKELDNSLVVALDINDKYQRDNKKLKERVQEAEGEMTIVKGIGMSSPEMREAKARIEELEEKLVKALAGDHRVAESDKIIMKKMEEIEQLKADLARAKEDHQYDNLVHKKELENLAKK